MESEEVKMIKSGTEELIGSVKEGIHLGGIVTGKGGQAETDKARNGSEEQGRVSTGWDSSGPSGHEDKIKPSVTTETINDDVRSNKITNEDLTFTLNKPDKLETTGLGTGGKNETGAKDSGFFPNGSTGGSNITLGNVQGNAFGYGSVEAPRVESINDGTGNVVTASNNTETVRNKTKETTASNSDEPKTPKVNTNNIIIGKNNNKKE